MLTTDWKLRRATMTAQHDPEPTGEERPEGGDITTRNTWPKRA